MVESRLSVDPEMRRGSLPQVVVEVPCHAEWSAMMPLERDGSVRFCDSCAKPVYDSRAMTRTQLHALIGRHEGHLPCMRLHLRPDGTIVTRDCFAPVLRLGRAAWLRIGLFAAAFWAWALGFRSGTEALRRAFTQRAAENAVVESRRERRLMGMPTVRRPPPRPSENHERFKEALTRTPGWNEGLVRIANGLLAPIDHAPPLRYLEADEEEMKVFSPRPSR